MDYVRFMGYLKKEQEVALTNFRKTLEKEKETFNYDISKFEDDYTLLRFLRARKFNLEKTLKMFKNFITWRIEFHTDDILVIV